jgi:hypothetical protein
MGHQAVREIKVVARRDQVLGADGAVAFLERLSPALENVDSSSGAIGTAVNSAIAELVRIIGDAPADARTRDSWLERLWAAHEADRQRLLPSGHPAGYPDWPMSGCHARGHERASR